MKQKSVKVTINVPEISDLTRPVKILRKFAGLSCEKISNMVMKVALIVGEKELHNESNKTIKFVSD